MGISTKQLIDSVNNATNNSSLSAIQLAQLSGAVETSVRLYNVSKFSDLPNPVLNTGRMIFVDTLNKYFYSNGFEWTDNIESPNLVLWSWGNNSYGVLGDNSTVSRSSPGTTSGGGTNWSTFDINDYGYNIGAIKTDSTLWTWGRNSYGQLGDGTTTSRSSPGTTDGGGTNWSKIAVGQSHMAGIKTDGTILTWGYNFYGQLGDGTITSKQWPGYYVGFDTTWREISASGYSTAAIKTDGTLWTWGANGYGILGDGTVTSRRSPGTTAGGGTNWTFISCGPDSMSAIKTDGTLWTWGRNNYGKLGDDSIGNKSSPGTTAGGGTNWSMVASGRLHTTAIKTDGTLWTWGTNYAGPLGTGDTASRQSPVTTAGGGTNWSMVCAGSFYTAAIKTDGTLWTWGYNGSGQLGDGTITSRLSPGTTAGGGTTWSYVNAGGYVSFAIG